MLQIRDKQRDSVWPDTFRPASQRGHESSRIGTTTTESQPDGRPVLHPAHLDGRRDPRHGRVQTLYRAELFPAPVHHHNRNRQRRLQEHGGPGRRRRTLGRQRQQGQTRSRTIRALQHLRQQPLAPLRKGLGRAPTTSRGVHEARRKTAQSPCTVLQHADPQDLQGGADSEL